MGPLRVDRYLPPSLPRQDRRRDSERSGELVGGVALHGHSPHRADLQLHVRLRRPLRNVRQLEDGRSQVRHDAGAARRRDGARFLGRRRESQHLRRRAHDAERSAGDGGAVSPPPPPDAQDRHQHHGPHAAPRHSHAHAHRASSAPRRTCSSACACRWTASATSTTRSAR